MPPREPLRPPAANAAREKRLQRLGPTARLAASAVHGESEIPYMGIRRSPVKTKIVPKSAYRSGTAIAQGLSHSAMNAAFEHLTK